MAKDRQCGIVLRSREPTRLHHLHARRDHFLADAVAGNRSDPVLLHGESPRRKSAVGDIEAAHHHDISWEWVKGHNGDVGNERADALANRGAAQAGVA